MRSGFSYQGHDHQEAIEQLAKTNDILPYMIEGGSKFDAEDFYQNMVPATLHPAAQVEYIKRGNRNLRGKDKVLDLLEKLQERIEAEVEIKHSNKRRNNNNFKSNNDASTHNNNDDRDGNRCRKKGHNHL